MTQEGQGNGVPLERLPALLGALSQDQEAQRPGGGAGPKEFVPPSVVRQIFDLGIQRLEGRVSRAASTYDVPAAIASIKLRPQAIAKSHRHESLFQGLQVAGVSSPGEILAVVTPNAIRALGELVGQATTKQLQQFSSVEDLSWYEPSVIRGDRRSVVTLFDGRLDDGNQLIDVGLRAMEHVGVSLKEYGKLINTYLSDVLPSEEELREMPWIRRVQPIARFRPNSFINSQPISEPQFGLSGGVPIPIVGVFDSGMDPSITWLNNLVVARQHPFPQANSDYAHGSLVGALAASGGGFSGGGNPYPPAVARLVDIQVFGSGSDAEIDEDDLLIQLENAVEIYGPRSTNRPAGCDQPVVIWNLSLGTGSPCSEGQFSDSAFELDRIAKDNDVLFTISAGNYDPPLRSWTAGVGPSIVTAGADRVSVPADSALGISVGSLSHDGNPPSAVPADYPSPFSRRGPGAAMLVKPEMVHYGGTCDVDGNNAMEIQGPANGDGVLASIGTSFAAPRVAAAIASMVPALPYPDPNLLKVLAVLSCEPKGDHRLEVRESVNYYGFGIPNDPIELLECDPWECTILFSGELRPGFRLQIPIPYPASLTRNNTRRGWLSMALAYTPVLDSTKGAEYCQTNVTASLGRTFDYPEGDPRRYKREVSPVPQHSLPSGLEKDLVEMGWKWSPIKVYQRTINRMPIHPKETGWRLTIDLLLRRELEPQREYVRQPFWVAVRICDPDRQANVYQEIRQQMQALGLATPIQVRQQVRSAP